jgi:hypothetical protein
VGKHPSLSSPSGGPGSFPRTGRRDDTRRSVSRSGGWRGLPTGVRPARASSGIVWRLARCLRDRPSPRTTTGQRTGALGTERARFCCPVRTAWPCDRPWRSKCRRAPGRPPVTDPAWSRRPSPHDNDPDADYQYSRFRLWAEPECRLVCGPRRQRATWPGIWLAFNRSLCRLSALDAPQLQKARNSSKPSGFGANLPAGFPSSASPTQPRSSGLARPAIKFCVS